MLIYYNNFFVILTGLLRAATYTTCQASQTSISAHASKVFSCCLAACIFALLDLFKVDFRRRLY